MGTIGIGELFRLSDTVKMASFAVFGRTLSVVLLPPLSSQIINSGLRAYFLWALLQKNIGAFTHLINTFSISKVFD